MPEIAAERPLRVGLVGLGTMGRNHLRTLVERVDVSLVAICDPSDTARAAAVRAAPAARAFGDPRAMLDEEQLDAVVVAVPTQLHLSVALPALERGLAVLVEKPIAGDARQAAELIRAAEASGAMLQVGHIERFNPAVQELVERLRGGALSRIFSIKTIRGGPLPERIRDVGVAIDLGTHDLDIMCLVAGERPVRAYAEVTRHVHTQYEDLVYGLLSFRSGALGQIDVNWLTPEKQRRIVVLGPEGMFQVDYLRQSLTFTRGAHDLEPSYLDGYAPVFAGDTVTLPVRPAEPLKAQLDAFVRAVRAGGPSPVSGEDGLWALALANLLLESATTGQPVDVDLAGVA